MNEKTMLEADRKRLRRWIESQGQVFSDDPAIAAAAEPVFCAIQKFFPDFWECVTLPFCYVVSEQPEDLRADGYCWVDVTSDAGVLYGIGLSYEATEKGFQYSALVVLHELAHVLCGIAEISGSNDHDQRFHSILDGLIERFNAKTGMKIKNDYFGLESDLDNPKNH